MAGSRNANPIFRYYLRVHPFLWLLVTIWIAYYARGMLFYAMSFVWSALKTILGWWKAIAKTLYTLFGQLCIALPGTAIACLIGLRVVYPITSISYSYIVDLITSALSPPPPPRLFQYTHTHTAKHSRMLITRTR